MLKKKAPQLSFQFSVSYKEGKKKKEASPLVP